MKYSSYPRMKSRLLFARNVNCYFPSFQITDLYKADAVRSGDGGSLKFLVGG